MDAGLQLAAKPVDTDAERVHRDPGLVGELLPVADVVLSRVALSRVASALVIPQHQVPLVRRELAEAPAEAVETVVGGFAALLEADGRPAAPLDDRAVLPGRTAQDLLVDQVGDAAEVAVGIARPQLHPFGQPAGDAVDRLVGEVFGGDAAAPFEEADQLAADGLVDLARPVAVGVELGEQGVEALRRQPAEQLRRLGAAVASRAVLPQRHSPWRENPAQ